MLLLLCDAQPQPHSHTHIHTQQQRTPRQRHYSPVNTPRLCQRERPHLSTALLPPQRITIHLHALQLLPQRRRHCQLLLQLRTHLVDALALRSQPAAQPSLGGLRTMHVVTQASHPLLQRRRLVHRSISLLRRRRQVAAGCGQRGGGLLRGVLSGVQLIGRVVQCGA